jgi:hypothetical protein
MRSGSIIAPLFLSFLTLAVPAASEETSAQAGPCRADAERYCDSAGKEKGARFHCLRKHETELSPACRKKVESRRGRGAGSKRIGGLEEPCGDDLREHCPDVEKHGAQLRCLRAHSEELSAKCSERMTKKKREPEKSQPES